MLSAVETSGRRRIIYKNAAFRLDPSLIAQGDKRVGNLPALCKGGTADDDKRRQGGLSN